MTQNQHFILKFPRNPKGPEHLKTRRMENPAVGGILERGLHGTIGVEVGSESEG